MVNKAAYSNIAGLLHGASLLMRAACKASGEVGRSDGASQDHRFLNYELHLAEVAVRESRRRFEGVEE